jgi:hypothetical protein
MAVEGTKEIVDVFAWEKEAKMVILMVPAPPPEALSETTNAI